MAMSEAQVVREERPAAAPVDCRECAHLRGVVARALAIIHRSRGGTVSAVRRILEGAPLR